MGNKYKKLVGNTALFAVGNFGSKIISLLMVPLYTRQLSTAQYGTVDILLTTINLLIPFITLELGQAAMRLAIESKTPSEKDKIYYNILSFSKWISLSLIILTPILYVLNIMKPYIILFMILLILTQFNVILGQFVRGLGYVKEYAFNGILQTVTVVVSNLIFLVLFNFKIDGYILSMILGNLISNIYLFIISKGARVIGKRDLKSKSLIKEMALFSMPLIPNTTIWWIINGATRYFILFFLNSSANGLYAVANKIPTIISTVGNIFIQSWQLSSFEEYKSADKNEFNTNIFNLYSSFLFCLASGILVVLNPIIKIIISTEFYDSWKLVPFLLLGVIYQSLSGFLGVNYTASRATKGAFTSSIYGGIVSVISNVIFIPFFGLIGATFASFVSFFTMWLIRLVDTRKYTIIKINWCVFISTNIIFLLQIWMLFLTSGSKQIVIEAVLFLILIITNIKSFIRIIKLIFYRNNMA
ncbi:lipopolysaccharide biosynthesis protein [Aerococcus viridans]